LNSEYLPKRTFFKRCDWHLSVCVYLSLYWCIFRMVIQYVWSVYRDRKMGHWLVNV